MLTIVQAFFNPFFRNLICFCLSNADIFLLFDRLISLRGKSQEAMTAYRRDFLFT